MIHKFPVDLYIHLMLSEGNQPTIRGFRYDDQDIFARQRRGGRYLRNARFCAKRRSGAGAGRRGCPQRFRYRCNGVAHSPPGSGGRRAGSRGLGRSAERGWVGNEWVRSVEIGGWIASSKKK